MGASSGGGRVVGQGSGCDICWVVLGGWVLVDLSPDSAVWCNPHPSVVIGCYHGCFEHCSVGTWADDQHDGGILTSSCFFQDRIQSEGYFLL